MSFYCGFLCGVGALAWAQIICELIGRRREARDIREWGTALDGRFEP